MMKKRLAVLLCGAMLLGTGSVAFAEENTDAQATEAEASDESAEEEAVEVPDAAKDSYDKLQEAEKTLKTTDDHLMMEAPLSFDVPEVDGDAAYCEDNYEETDANHWHYKEYLDWDEANDAKFPESPADGQEGKKVILIVHGAHAWTTCYTEAFQKACDAVGMEVTVYDPNWDQGNQDSYIDQAINEHPDAIALIPLSADHATQQFKKITDAGIPAFCVNTTPEAEAMNYIISYTGPNDWYQMRTLADMLGEKMEGKDIIPSACEDIPEETQAATAAGRGYAIAGGVAGAIEACLKEYYPDVPVHIEHAESLAECKKVLTLAKAGKIKNCMIEGMACPGGCIGGAGTNAGFAKTSKALKKYVDGSDPKIPSQELENLELN